MSCRPRVIPPPQVRGRSADATLPGDIQLTRTRYAQQKTQKTNTEDKHSQKGDMTMSEKTAELAEVTGNSPGMPEAHERERGTLQERVQDRRGGTTVDAAVGTMESQGEVAGKTGLIDRLLALSGDDRGMSTIEYALGCVAAAALGALLYVVVTSDSVEAALTGIFERALDTK